MKIGEKYLAVWIFTMILTKGSGPWSLVVYTKYRMSA
jgi:hypothetical protein